VSDSRLGRRYADGLYNAALKNDKVEEVVVAMTDLHQAFETIPELWRYWRGYELTPKQKKSVVSEAFADVPKLVSNLLFFLIDKKRETILFDIFKAFALRHDDEKGIVRATLTTAIDLEEEEVSQFVSVLKRRFGGEITLKKEVDPSLIAGFRLRYGNRIVDASVERSINEIRRRVSA
jgi:F-type H+-transporting ATPase subunit delta